MTTIIKRNPITMDGKYKTEAGDNVRILCVDAGGDYPVVGLVDGDDAPQCWTSDGFFDRDRRDSGYNLVAAPETHIAWMNVYENFYAAHVSEEKARKHARRDTIAVAVPVTFEVRK